MYFVLILAIGFFVGVVGVGSNPSSSFAVSALVAAAGFGCGMLAVMGNFFLSVMLYLVYLGGMLVVFAYSVALSSDLYPKAWGKNSAGVSAVCYMVVCSLLLVHSVYTVCSGGYHCLKVGVGDFDVGFGGICVFYSMGGWILVVVVSGLLLTLFVVLELVRGVSFGALKSF